MFFKKIFFYDKGITSYNILIELYELLNNDNYYFLDDGSMPGCAVLKLSDGRKR